MGAAIGTARPDYCESAAAEVFHKLAAIEAPLGWIRAGGGGSRPGEGLVLQRGEYVSHAAVLRDARLVVQVRCTERGIMRVTSGHLRPSGHIMPDHAGDRGAVLLVLAPHDHLHIKHDRALLRPEVGG